MYNAYILTKVKPRGATNKIISIFIQGNRQILSLENGTAENKWGNQFQTNKFSFFMKDFYLIIIGS